MKLERLTYAVLILTCIISMGLLVEQRYRRAEAARGGTGADSVAQHLIGKQLNVPGIASAAARLHAVLFITERCGVCVDSAPLFKQLSDLRQGRPDISLSAVSVDSEKKLRSF